MTLDLALAMSRFLVFAGVMLTLLRVAWEGWREARRGCPFPRLAIRRLSYLPLLGVLAYYARALFWPGIPSPTQVDLVLINALLGLFFFATAWPRRMRATDRFGRWR